MLSGDTRTRSRHSCLPGHPTTACNCNRLDDRKHGFCGSQTQWTQPLSQADGQGLTPTLLHEMKFFTLQAWTSWMTTYVHALPWRSSDACRPTQSAVQAQQASNP